MWATRCMGCAGDHKRGLFVLPSFVLLCLLSGIYVEFGDVTVVEGVVARPRCCRGGLVAAAVIASAAA